MKSAVLETTDLEPPDSPYAIVYRAWLPDDSADEVTRLLHRSFAKLAQMGLPCASASQPPEKTLARIANGHCLVAVANGRIIGTITVYDADSESCCPTYREHRVASIGQFAVEPSFQGLGVGSALLRLAECRATQLGYTVVALDTPQAAWHLLAFYVRQGFRLAEALRFNQRTYLSQVLRKSLIPGEILLPATAWI